jgi:hypothetical protein
MMSKKRIIEVPKGENSYKNQIEPGHATELDESLIKGERDMDIIPEDDAFENLPYEPPAPGEGP